MVYLRISLNWFEELLLHDPDVGADGNGREVDVGDGVVDALDRRDGRGGHPLRVERSDENQA